MSVTAHSSFPIPGTSVRRACWHTWALRRWPPPAWATPSPSDGVTTRLAVTTHWPTPPRSPLPPTCLSAQTLRMVLETLPKRLPKPSDLPPPQELLAAPSKTQPGARASQFMKEALQLTESARRSRQRVLFPLLLL